MLCKLLGMYFCSNIPISNIPVVPKVLCHFHVYFLTYDGFCAHTFKTLKSKECEDSRKGQNFKPFNFVGHEHSQTLPQDCYK